MAWEPALPYWGRRECCALLVCVSTLAALPRGSYSAEADGDIDAYTSACGTFARAAHWALARDRYAGAPDCLRRREAAFCHVDADDDVGSARLPLPQGGGFSLHYCHVSMQDLRPSRLLGARMGPLRWSPQLPLPQEGGFSPRGRGR